MKVSRGLGFKYEMYAIILSGHFFYVSNDNNSNLQTTVSIASFKTQNVCHDGYCNHCRQTKPRDTYDGKD